MAHVLLIFLLFLSVTVEAKLFQNSYVSFELPPRWDCQSEGTEWVCRSSQQQDSKTAIIILTAKEVGPTDSLSQYENYLKTPKTIPDAKGASVTSQVKGVKLRKINNHDWIDGLHLGSEIPTYYTRYLATVKQNIAVLVTFSAHKKYYTKFSNDFFKAILSLKITAPDKITSQAGGIRAGNETLGAGGAFPGDIILDEGVEYPEEQNTSSSTKETLFGFGLILTAIGIYIFLKRRKKNS